MKTRFRRVRHLGFVGAITLLLGATAGCGSLPLEDQIVVDYSGPKLNYVHACVALASSGQRRDDPSIPTSIKADQIEAKQGRADGAFYYSVSGRLLVTYGPVSQAKYEWECEVRDGYTDGQPSLTAVLLSFEGS